MLINELSTGYLTILNVEPGRNLLHVFLPHITLSRDIVYEEEKNSEVLILTFLSSKNLHYSLTLQETS